MIPDGCIDSQTHTKICILAEQFKPLFKKDEFKYLTDHTSQTSKFYILPKIHKNDKIKQSASEISTHYLHLNYMPNDLECRPIINNINSPTARISHFIDSILKPIVNLVPGYIKNSYDFLSKLPNLITDDSIFLSLVYTQVFRIIWDLKQSIIGLPNILDF